MPVPESAVVQMPGGVVLLVWQPSSYPRRPHTELFLQAYRSAESRDEEKILSHSTLVESTVFAQLPVELQATAKTLNTQVAEFRNEHVEHEMQYWRKRKTEFAGRQTGASPQVGMTLPADGKVYPERPLRDLWISIHDYVTDVAKFLGSQIG